MKDNKYHIGDFILYKGNLYDIIRINDDNTQIDIYTADGQLTIPIEEVERYNPNPNNLSFTEAISILGLQEYEKDIWNASATGELYHIFSYILKANQSKEYIEEYKAWFEKVIKLAKDKGHYPAVLMRI